jgi:hypothetical protein
MPYALLSSETTLIVRSAQGRHQILERASLRRPAIVALSVVFSGPCVASVIHFRLFISKSVA